MLHYIQIIELILHYSCTRLGLHYCASSVAMPSRISVKVAKFPQQVIYKREIKSKNLYIGFKVTTEERSCTWKML